MSDWTGSIDLALHRPPEMKSGDRILVRSPAGDYVMVVDDVSEPDADGVKRATAHMESAEVGDLYYPETHESPAQPEDYRAEWRPDR